MNFSQKTPEELLEIEEKLGYTFMNESFIIQALTHTSFVYEKGKNYLDSNQRLEFLGDAILQIVISEFLFSCYPNMPEGELSRLRSKIVCEQNLYETAGKLQLGMHLILSDSEEKTGGRKKSSIQADVIEAIIGAMYLDSGIKAARKFVIEHIEVNPQKLQYNKDYKTALQEYVQRDSKYTATYKNESAIGPEHAKIFTVSVWHMDKKLGQGIGKSRKKAEQTAAKNALEKLGAINAV